MNTVDIGAASGTVTVKLSEPVSLKNPKPTITVTKIPHGGGAATTVNAIAGQVRSDATDIVTFTYPIPGGAVLGDKFEIANDVTLVNHESIYDDADNAVASDTLPTISLPPQLPM